MDPGVTTATVPADQLPIAPRNATPVPPGTPFEKLGPYSPQAVADYLNTLKQRAPQGPQLPPEVMAELTRDSGAAAAPAPPQVTPGSAPVAQSAPTAAEQLRPMMEPIPSPMRKAVADANYRAVKTGEADQSTAGPAYEAAARADKTQNLADAADGVGVTYSQLKKLPMAQLNAKLQEMAKAIGERHFSDISVEHFMDLMKMKGK